MAVTSAAGGCGIGSTGRGSDASPAPTAAAVDACLRAAVEHLDFPLEGPGTTTVSVERDDKGWWAVQATAGEGGAAMTLTCTAVPDETDGARAASWSVTPAA